MEYNLESSIFLLEKKYNKVFTDYEELSLLLNKHFQIKITKDELYNYEDNYYSQLEKEDRELILKNVMQ